MRVGIVGTGTMGMAIASLAARHGHDVFIGSRQPRRAAEVAADTGARGSGTYRQAVCETELTFYCIPWEHSGRALELVGDCSGRVLVDVSNPETPDGRSLALGYRSSGAEHIAAASGAHVVKALNHVYAEILASSAALSRLAPTVLLCADAASAKDLAAQLLRSCGLDTLDCGPLAVARYLEPLAMLMVQIVRGQGFEPAGVALRLVRAPDRSGGRADGDDLRGPGRPA